MNVGDTIIKLVKKKKLHFSLLDPDKQSPKVAGEIAKTVTDAGSSAIMVGGSTVSSQKQVDETVKPIKQNSYADKLLEIENSLNAEKPDLSGSTTKLARLKSEINKAHNYSDFLKTKEGKQIIMLDNKLIKMKMNRR